MVIFTQSLLASLFEIIIIKHALKSDYYEDLQANVIILKPQSFSCWCTNLPKVFSTGKHAQTLLSDFKIF